MPYQDEEIDALLANVGSSYAPEPRRERDEEIDQILGSAEGIIATIEKKQYDIFAKQKQEQLEIAKMEDFAKRSLKEAWFPNLKTIGIVAGANWVSPIARITGQDETAEHIRKFSAAYQKAALELDVTGVIPAWIKRAFRGMGVSAPTMILTGAALGPYGAIGTAAAQEADDAISEGRQAGLHGAELMKYSVSQGVIEGGVASLFQRVGLGGAETIVGGKAAVSAGTTQALKRLGINALQELPEEVITELGHNVATSVYGVDPNATSIKSLARTAADTTAQTLMTMGVIETPNLIQSHGVMKEIKKAEKIKNEIIEVAQKRHTPSVEQWKKWGLSEEIGRNRKDRRKSIKQLASAYQANEQAQALLTGIAPTSAQWQQWGYPEEAGQNAPQRLEYLSRRILGTPYQAPVAPETAPVTPGEAVAGEPIQTTSKPIGQPTGAGEIQKAPELDAAFHDFPVEYVQQGKEQIGGREVVRRIEQIWGVPILGGRLNIKGARGVYYTRSQIAALARGEESSSAIAIHEIVGHHLDNTTDILSSASEELKKEVSELDYDQDKKRVSEGFAEFVRAYLTGATANEPHGIDLAKVTPKFLEHFNTWLDANPEISEKFFQTGELITSFIRSGAVGRVLGQISETGVDVTTKVPFVQRLNELKEFLYTRIKEEGRPIKRFTDIAIKKGYKPESITPFETYNALRQIGPHFAANALEKGVFRLGGNMEKIGPSLREVLYEINSGEDYKNFIAWAYARHAMESWEHGKNPGITLDDANEVYKQLHDSRYERAANKLTQFNDALIDVLADAGVMDQETAERIKAEYQNYLPLERAKQGRIGFGGRRIVDLPNVVKKRFGSGLQIIDPVESSFSRAIRFYERASKQLVTNELFRAERTTPGLGGWIKELPPKVIQTKFSFEEIKKQLKDAIEDQSTSNIMVDDVLSSIDPMTALMIWRPDLAVIKGVPIVKVLVGGKPIFAQLDSELANALGGLETLQNLGMVTKVARAFTSMLKIGATRANLDFIISNALRDFQTFLMQGERGLSGTFDPAKYAAAYVITELRAASGLSGDPIVEQFKKMGGELSTYAGMDRLRLRKGVKRALKTKQGITDTVLNLASVSEVGSRIAEFAAILDKQGWLDKVKAGQSPPLPVLIKAINAAHDVTVDFRRMGKWGRYLSYYIPFFNATLEGTDKTIRTFKDHPSRTAMRVGMKIVTTALIYWWLRHDDDDYKERPEWQDSCFIIKDDDGNPLYRIPKSQEWGVLESGIERMMDMMYEKSPEPMERWFKQAIETANPGVYPSGITPVFETIFNYDSFRHRPVVSRRLQSLRGPDQYYDYTSGVAKQVANFLDKASGGRIALSPAKIDHIANGLSGGLYGKIDSTGERVLTGEWSMNSIPGFKGITLRKEYTKSIDDFYTVKENLDKLHESGKLHKTEDVKNLNAWRRMQNISSLMSDIRKAERNMSAEDKIKINLAMTGLARAALGRSPLDRYPNPLSDISVVPKEIAEIIMDHIARKAVSATAVTSEYSQGAIIYLKDMGVNFNLAETLAYNRLRMQGMLADTAKNRSAMLRKIP